MESVPLIRKIHFENSALYKSSVNKRQTNKMLATWCVHLKIYSVNLHCEETSVPSRLVRLYFIVYV